MARPPAEPGGETDGGMTLSATLVTTLGWLFTVSGAGLALVAIWHFTPRRAFIRGSSVATGVVVALWAEPDGSNIQPLGYPQIRLRAAPGREITFESRMARGGGAWTVDGQARDASPHALSRLRRGRRLHGLRPARR
jgi:hypothetical protein